MNDPLGLAFLKKTAEVFVANRFGNSPPASGGTITRFLYDAVTETFTPNGQVTGNGLGAVGQIVFSPSEDELYAANVTQGSLAGSISMFKVDAMGGVTPDGVLAITGSTTVGLAVAPDGKRLYVASGSTQAGVGDTIRQFALPVGADGGTQEYPPLQIATADRLHFMTRSGADLYVGDPRSGSGPTAVYHLKISAGDDLTLVDTISATNPISVALSPDSLELFAVAHQVQLGNGAVDRFMTNGDGGWTPTTTITPPSSLGGTLVFPTAAVPTR